MKTKPLFYTFGNHMHWVDMQWLWGYQVLPDCIDDQLKLTRETGSPGNVNFEGIGYEKLAAESPEAMQRLRESIARGDADVVGGSYGQPYGLFQGGESNIRQFTMGVRSCLRCVGVRPVVFWEEEFYFFPQLPQVLALCGYAGANLFFQWTWHTPEIPREDASLIVWEGVDGTGLPALPRNSLNVHQWPEDFDGLLDQGLIETLDSPVIVQWLELMPTPDWMCRSELLLPRLKELHDDPRFELRAMTCRGLIERLSHESSDLPVRRYHPDEVWHGMTLGKNADRHPRMSRRVERLILAAETMATIASLAGRPYPSWDVYPTWELEESWRELLAAQHHDNHECEGLCGYVGHHQFARAEHAAGEVFDRTLQTLALRVGGRAVCNTLPWKRVMPVPAGADGEASLAEVPACCVIGVDVLEKREAMPVTVGEASGSINASRGTIGASVDRATAMVSSITSDGREALAKPFGALTYVLDGKPRGVSSNGSVSAVEGGRVVGRLRLEGTEDAQVPIEVALPAHERGVDVVIGPFDRLPRPDFGFGGALRLPIAPAIEIDQIRVDAPLSAHAAEGSAKVQRKYPTGDWMTSPQRFETVEGSIVAHSWVNLIDASGAGLLVIHDGSQQLFRTDGGVEFILNAYDPWDEDRYDPVDMRCRFRLIPHAGMSDAACTRAARAFDAEPVEARLRCVSERARRGVIHSVGGGGSPLSAPTMDSVLGPKLENAGGAVIEAVHRSNPHDGKHLPDWAGHAIARASEGQALHPWVVRLVEWEGSHAEPALLVPGTVVSAHRVNLMGEPRAEDSGGALAVEPVNSPDGGRWSRIVVPMRAHEIATVMLDVVESRKQWRNLDAKREVWATVHRVDEGG